MQFCWLHRGRTRFCGRCASPHRQEVTSFREEGGRRQMARLLEYQGKRWLEKAGLPVPKGREASTPEEARQIAEELGKPVALSLIHISEPTRLGMISYA